LTNLFNKCHHGNLLSFSTSPFIAIYTHSTIHSKRDKHASASVMALYMDLRGHLVGV
jgi:hypothetical protein